MTEKLRRYKVRVTTPEGDSWSEPIAARGMYAALQTWADRDTSLPAPRRAGGAEAGKRIAAREPGWHLTIVPEESWPAAAAEGMQR